MRLLLFLAVCHGVGLTGAVATARGLREWYPRLKKPSWTPPNGVFAPVWLTLYTMMAVAGWLVSDDSSLLIWFGLQLAANGLWSPFFFGLQEPGLALADIVVLWISIAACVHYFPPLAATLMVPYWMWVSFATMLNFEIWRLNRASV